MYHSGCLLLGFLRSKSRARCEQLDTARCRVSNDVLCRQSSLDLKALGAQIAQTDEQIAHKDVQMSDLNQQARAIRTQQVGPDCAPRLSMF